MIMNDYWLLTGFYLLSLAIVGGLIYCSYKQQAFSFHLLFSLIYFASFYLGYPFSMALALGFDISLQQTQTLFLTLFCALVGYVIYYLSYAWRLTAARAPLTLTYSPFQQFSASEARICAALLMLIALGTVGYFLSMNGLLLFKLDSYSQIFSANEVSGVALKRFFYFFIPALLILFFLYENKKAWLAFLVLGVAFGALTYVSVGGTRANIALAFVLFFFIGIYKGYLSILWLAVAGLITIVAMFFLAMARYGLDVQGSEALFTFLYLTRDTFSPWENFALLLANDVEHQGLMPIVRDFYVFIPKSLWEARPDQILNTSNYFTWEVLDNRSGLAISPTLLGSFYIMGGFPMIALGMAFVGLLMKGLDALFALGARHIKRSYRAIIQAFCFANIFNVIVLVREGADAFFSRFVFFSAVFVSCWLVAFFITYLFEKMSLIKTAD